MDRMRVWKLIRTSFLSQVKICNSSRVVKKIIFNRSFRSLDLIKKQFDRGYFYRRCY